MKTGASSPARPIDAPLLDAYPAIASRSPDEAEHLLRRIYGARHFAVAGDRAEFSIHANHKPISDISLSYCGYGGSVDIDFPEAGFARQMFRLSGEGIVQAGLRGPELRVASSLVLPPDIPLKVHFAEGFRQLLLRIDEAALTRKLTALLGSEPGAPVRFDPIQRNGEGDAALRSLVMSLAQGIRALEEYAGSSPVIPEFEQTIITTFLYTNLNNYSRALRAAPRDAAPWQVRAVEDYISGNWQEPLDTRKLVEITGVSARSIFQAFARTRGYSPNAFLKRTRLTQARGRLQSGDMDVSVTAIALACGFNNLGHFARDYRTFFGELPSETLARQRSKRPRSA